MPVLFKNKEATGNFFKKLVLFDLYTSNKNINNNKILKVRKMRSYKRVTNFC